MNIYYLKWNRAHRGIYNKGRKAFEDGLSINDCPYKDKRKDNNKLTWSRSFILTWEEGFMDAKKGIPIPTKESHNEH